MKLSNAKQLVELKKKATFYRREENLIKKCELFVEEEDEILFLMKMSEIFLRFGWVESRGK
jgi:hypothetical protein